MKHIFQMAKVKANNKKSIQERSRRSAEIAAKGQVKSVERVL